MRFALDTFKEIVHGTPEERFRAISGFTMWVIAGAFLMSTVFQYVAPFEGMASELLGGFVVAAIVTAIKVA